MRSSGPEKTVSRQLCFFKDQWTWYGAVVRLSSSLSAAPASIVSLMVHARGTPERPRLHAVSVMRDISPVNRVTDGVVWRRLASRCVSAPNTKLDGTLVQS